MRDEDWGKEGAADAGTNEFARMLEQFESSREAGTPAVGSRVRGRIVQLGPEISFVDFGGRSEGSIETVLLRDADGNLTCQVGDAVELFVIDSKDQVILAPSVRAEPSVAYSQVLDAHRAGMPVTGRVSGQNSGGLEVDIAGLRGFCPFSQVEAGFCPDPSIYLGRTLEFLVQEVGEGGKKLVVSRKALLRRQEEERLRELLASLHEGAEMEGAVARLESFGAFVDLGGVDGLVHVSEIRHERTESPAEVLSVGQTVRVKILGISQKEGGRPKISLSMKAVAPDPWDDVNDRFWAGRKIEGAVVRLTDFGAFVNLAPGIDGLVHVSEIDLRPVAHPKDALTVGQVVRAAVLSVDASRRRISLSIKDVLAAEAPPVDGDAAAGGAVQTAAEPRNPTPGDLADGWVAGVKPYGLFVDLPAYGHRARGLVPHEETGEKQGTDLTRRFRVGDQLRVEIVDVDAEGKIRLSLTRARDRAENAQFQSFQQNQTASSKTPSTGMAEAWQKALEKKKGE
jgi:small subunit ribosomal protein S1